MNSKDTFFSPKLTITCQGRLVDFSVPRVMGILNVTPDSFYDGGRYVNDAMVISRVASMLEQGADIVDVGACTTRPGSTGISAGEEKSRLKMALGAIRKEFPEVLISIDTYRAEIAGYAIQEYGAGIINDISAGRMDDQMFPLAAKLKSPVILMHMQGVPETMQVSPVYDDIVKEIMIFFADRAAKARYHGINDLIIDPGFGFGKTMKHNFQMLRELSLFNMLEMPLMVGISRKSMVYKPIDAKPEDALNGTTVLNTLALSNGANILRVHDVMEAIQAIRLFMIYSAAKE